MSHHNKSINPVHDKFLYVHLMKIGVEHRLEKTEYKFKDHVRDSLAEISQITECIYMEIGSRVFMHGKVLRNNHIEQNITLSKVYLNNQ